MTIKELKKLIRKLPNDATVEINDCADFQISFTCNQDGEWTLKLSPTNPN